MEKAGITTGKFIAGIVIAILVSSAVSIGISTQLLVAGPQGPQGVTGATGATGATGPEGPPGPQGPYLPDYDSGWVDITNEAGRLIDITHNLNSEDTIVDIRGKTTASGEAHQRCIGLTGNIPGWTKTYGGTGEDVAYSVIQTADGGYALAGVKSGAPSSDFWLVKTDSAGNQQWNKAYGGMFEDYAYSVIQTADGGYALAGVKSGAASSDFWLVKTDSAGNQQWNKTYGGIDVDVAYSVVQTTDGGYALAGFTSSYGSGGGDFWLVKTYANGTMQWNKTYGGIDVDVAYSAVQTVDGGYALAGYTGYMLDHATYDFWLVKTDSAGNQQWNKTYGGMFEDNAYCVVQTADGGYALAGYTLSAGRWDAMLVKTDSVGNQQWNQTYGEISEDEASYCVVQTADGGYALAGYGYSSVTDSPDSWLVKTDSAGNQQWNKTYGGTGGDTARSVVQTADGGYALAGSTTSYGAGGKDFLLVKTDVESGLAWTDSTANTITLYRGATDIQWNYVRVRIWKIE